MDRGRILLALLGFTFLLGATGCSGSSDNRRYLVRPIHGADADAATTAAEVILRREFGRVTINRDRHTIETQPAEYQTSSESGTARDFYGGQSTMRRIGNFSATPHGGECIVRLRIEVQRQDTRRTETMRQDQNRLSDTPAYTPIERDAATTTEQNTVWTFVKRDYSLERALLAELQEQFAAEPAAADSQPAKP